MDTKCETCGSDCNERDELIKAEREIDRLRAGYMRLRDASDNEMRDGDLARTVAIELLGPDASTIAGYF